MDAPAADQPVSRLQPGNTAIRRRPADRAAGVGAERRRHQPGRDRRARSARRTAGEMRGAPWVARRRPRQVERRPAMRELMRRQLAGQDGAGRVELFDRRRIFRRHGVDAHLGVPGGADAGGGIDVLEAERHPVQRAAVIAGGDLAFGLPRLRHRLVGGDRQIGIELRIDAFGARQRGLRQLDRRQLFAGDQPRHLGDRQVMQFFRHPRPPSNLSLVQQDRCQVTRF